MQYGYRPQVVPEVIVTRDTISTLQATAEERLRARKALETIRQLADAVLAGDGETIDRIQAEVRAAAAVAQ